MNQRTINVLLVGRYPPPYGGITVHLQRLLRALASEWRAILFDPYPNDAAGSPPIRVVRGKGSKVASVVAYATLLMRVRFRVVHFHTSGMSRFAVVGVPMLLLARWRGAKCVVSIHDGAFADRFERAHGGFRLALRAVLALSDHLVTVNVEQKRALTQQYAVSARRIAVIPAFLPPIVAGGSRYKAMFARWRAQGRTLVCTSGYGLDCYGFQQVIEAIAGLDASVAPALVVCLYHTIDERYRQRLAEVGADCEMVLTRNLPADEFAWILKYSDLYVRATDHDGDAVAIREALYLGTSVVASDCVQRPVGVVLFPTGNTRALGRCIAEALHPGAAPAIQPTANKLDGAAALCALYRGLLENNG